MQTVNNDDEVDAVQVVVHEFIQQRQILNTAPQRTERSLSNRINSNAATVVRRRNGLRRLIYRTGPLSCDPNCRLSASTQDLQANFKVQDLKAALI